MTLDGSGQEEGKIRGKRKPDFYQWAQLRKNIPLA